MSSAKKQRRLTKSTIISLTILLAIVLSVAGAFIWRAYTNRSVKPAQNNTATSERESCEKLYDKDVCTFIFTWKSLSRFRTISEAGGNKTVYEMDGDKAHIVMLGKTNYESMIVGQSMYAKSGDIWYRQVNKNAKSDAAARMKNSSLSFDFTKDYKGHPPFTFKSMGKEKCGDMNCFKYEATATADKDVKQTIWFNDKDYKPFRTFIQTKEDSFETMFEYDNIAITAPTQYKEFSAGDTGTQGQATPKAKP